ncbi:P-loop containing nucleoside triphosphate hydrolase protein [Boletus edulis]|nr:P-loop containing nucleoside triphosphate hydrolase protein [Boletus edulis]
MPRIRKKTSKRGTTRHRESIKHKISEHRKKTKKQARKDKATGKPVQKKSKKDPGIPNNFPYKDRILAEVEEQRRQAAAERQRRKEEKRAAAAGNGSNDLEKSPTPEDIAVDEKNGQGFDGIMSLRPVFIPQKKDNGNTVKERIPTIPVYPGPSTLRLVVQKADVVLHVVDARDPAAGMSEALVEAAQGKLMVLLNKADTVPRESLIQWLAHLRTSYTVLPFRPKDDALGLAGLWTHLDTLAQMKNGEELVVAVTGVTNTGKSAVINSILGSDSAKGPSTTTSAQEVVATMPGNDARRVRFIDTPGLEFVRGASSTDQEREMMRARDILLRCRGRIDRLKDPLFAVMHIVARVDTQDLILAYSLPAFLQGDSRVNRLIKKGGVLDHAGAARIVLRDWRTGKLMRYSMPAGAPEGMMEGDAPVLGSVKSRKELRSAVEVKLVKMDAGESDTRDIGWDVSWEEEEEEEEERSRDEDGDEEEEELPGRAAGSEDRPGKRRVSFVVETEKRRRRVV